MKNITCPNCSFEYPSDSRFCKNCGNMLERKCLNCGTVNEASARFFKQCGNRLEPQSLANQSGLEQRNHEITKSPTDPRLARLVANTPTVLADKIRSASQLSGEWRVMTALFADVVGSTALAGHMDPEDWTEVMNRDFDLLVPAVYL